MLIILTALCAPSKKRIDIAIYSDYNKHIKAQSTQTHTERERMYQHENQKIARCFDGRFPDAQHGCMQQ